MTTVKNPVENEEECKAETLFSIFEEYKRLSYDLNNPKKIDGQRIQRLPKGLEFDFLVNAPNDAGENELYLAKRIHTHHDGLIPFLLIPLDSSKNPCDARLTFQGTVSGSGWFRNLTGQNGPGINEIMANQDLIVQQLKTALHKIPGEVRLSLVGHSLGGADAQNMMMTLMDSIQQNHFPTIKELNLYAYNSAGVPEKIRLKSLQLASRMREKGVKIEANFSIVDNDVVHQTGDTTILVGMPPADGTFRLFKTNGEKTSVNMWTRLKTSIKALFNMHDLHNGHYFTPPEKGGHAHRVFKRKYYTNHTPEGMAKIRTLCHLQRISQSHLSPYLFAQILKGALRNVIHPSQEEEIFSEKKQTDRMVDFVMSDRNLRNGFYSLWGALPTVTSSPLDERENTFFHLLAQDADPHAINKFTKTLFSETIHSTCADQLLNKKNKEGKSPIDYMLEFGNIGLINRLLATQENKKSNPLSPFRKGMDWILHAMNFRNTPTLSSDTYNKLKQIQSTILSVCPERPRLTAR